MMRLFLALKSVIAMTNSIYIIFLRSPLAALCFLLPPPMLPLTLPYALPLTAAGSQKAQVHILQISW